MELPLVKAWEKKEAGIRLHYLQKSCATALASASSIPFEVSIGRALSQIRHNAYNCDQEENGFVRLFVQELQRIRVVVSGRATELKDRLYSLSIRTLGEGVDGGHGAQEARIAELADAVIHIELFARESTYVLTSVATSYDESSGSFRCAPGIEAGRSAGGFKEEYARVVYQFLIQDVDMDSLLWGVNSLFMKLRSYECSGKTCPAMMATDEFRRSTTKYWVSPAHTVQVKVAIMKHLPIYVYGWEDPASAPGPPLRMDTHRPQVSNLISSVYYDNEVLDTYHCRLRREDGARLVRLRWYNTPDSHASEAIYVERKKHRQSWTGEQSVKERVAMRHEALARFLSGSLSPASMTGVNPGKLPLLEEMQTMLTSQSQLPSLRTSYYRTAFQEYDTNSVRISMDENLVITRERGQPWHQATSGFSDDCGVSPRMRFPYCVLEVKLLDKTNVPQWVEDLTHSGMLVEVDAFSKFLHGSALLFPTKVRELPLWFTLDGQGSTMPMTIEQLGGKLPCEVQQTPHMQRPSPPSSAVTVRMPQVTTESVPRRPPESQELGHVSVSMKGAAGPSAFSVAGMSEADTNQSKRVKTPILSCFKGRGTRSFRGGGRAGGSANNQHLTGGTVPAVSVRAMLPTRVDPKTFFAAERTFLQWLNISVLIMLTGLTLLGGSATISGGSGKTCSDNDICQAVEIAGLIISPVSTLFMMYSLWRYRKRTSQILRREAVRYDDQKGPAIMTFVLIGVTLVTIVLTAWTLSM